MLVADRDFEEGGGALVGPELPSAFEAMLELGALGLHRTTADRQAGRRGQGVVQVVLMGCEVVVGGLDGRKDGLILTGGMGHEIGQGLEQLSRRAVLKGLQDRVGPCTGWRAVAEEFGGERLQVLTGVVAVERAAGAELATVFQDIPKPHGPVHDDVDLLGRCQAHPPRLVVDPAAKLDRIGCRRNGDDMF